MNKEVVEILFNNEKYRIEKIASHGAISPKGFIYDQSEDEIVWLESGSAILEVEGQEVKLNKGNTYYLPAHCKHKITYTSSDCVWHCIYIK